MVSFLEYALFPESSNTYKSPTFSTVQDFILHDKGEVENWISNREEHNDVSEYIELIGACSVLVQRIIINCI